MAKLHLKGYLCTDCDGIIALRENKEEFYYMKTYGKSIIESIEAFANKYGLLGIHNQGLGGTKAYIDDCNLRAYFTNEECELEDAMLAIDVMMYGGDIKTKVYLEGYSEYTITGMYLDEFSIGGHDLKREFQSHYEQYCHLIIEC